MGTERTNAEMKRVLVGAASAANGRELQAGGLLEFWVLDFGFWIETKSECGIRIANEMNAEMKRVLVGAASAANGNVKCMLGKPKRVR